MRLRELMGFLQEFMDNKGKGTKGELGMPLSLCM